MQAPHVFIVIPTYNERKNIIPLLKEIFSLGIQHLRVIVVDDASPDGTADAILQTFFRKKQVQVLRRPEKRGLGSAYVDGFSLALTENAHIVLQMDADHSHDPKDIPRLLAALDTADVAIGSRKIPGGSVVGWGPVRTFMSAGAMWYARHLLKLKTRDVTAGFRAFHRRVLTTIDLASVHSNGYAFQEEILFRVERAGFRVTEVPVIFRDRTHGASKLSKKDIIEFFLIIRRLRKFLFR